MTSPSPPFLYTDLGFLELWNGEQDRVIKGELGKAVVDEGNRFPHNLPWQDGSQLHDPVGRI